MDPEENDGGNCDVKRWSSVPSSTTAPDVNSSNNGRRKNMKRPRTKHHQQQQLKSQIDDKMMMTMNEDDLLAAVLGGGRSSNSAFAGGSGSTVVVQDMDTYEENVIRDAELNSTPRLLSQTSIYNSTGDAFGPAASSSSSSSDTGTSTSLSNDNNKNNSMNNELTFGFPSLLEIVPSGSGGGRGSGNIISNVMGDIPHVRRVLERLRQRQPYLTDTMDCLKEQMLLSFLHMATGDAELCVRPQHEAKQELERQKIFRHNLRMEGGTAVGGGAEDDNRIDDLQQQGSIEGGNVTRPTSAPPGKLKSALKRKRSRDDSGDYVNNIGSTAVKGHHDYTPSDRLEAIKRGEDRVVRFSSTASSTTNGSKTINLSSTKNTGSMKSDKTSAVAAILLPQLKRRIIRRRKSLQERREEDGRPDTLNYDNRENTTTSRGSRRQGPIGDYDDEDEEVEEEVETEESFQRRRQRLREVRKEREKRRQLKRNHRIGEKRGPKKKKTAGSEGERRLVRVEPNDRSDPQDIARNQEDATINDDEDATAMTVESERRRRASQTQQLGDGKSEEKDDNSSVDNLNVNAIICPLCQKNVPITTKITTTNDSDAVLAEHISICQQTNARPSRRRRQLATTVDMSLQQLEGQKKSDNDGNREENEKDNSATADSNTNKQSSERVGYVDMSDFDYDDDDDTEESASDTLGGDTDASEEEEDEEDASDGDDGNKEKGEKKRGRASSRSRRKTTSKRRKVKGTPTTAPSASSHPIDDWDEEDYEDRVDDWIEHGLDKMKTMKEQDTTERPPGEDVYDGGLVVPAWINDRLFPYQRTGLQWMWELHRQQCGGILGDEMGLGKTVQVASFLGSMAASRKLKSILIIAPATMLQHWLKELAVWAPGIRRILIHQSGEGTQQFLPFSSVRQKRNISHQRLTAVDQWLKESRKNRLYEIIDEDDLETRDPHSFCGTAVCFVTTYENIRRNDDVWTRHRWSYVVMDEAQKIKNNSADITQVCKRFRTPHRLALSGTPIQNDLRELWSLVDFVIPGRLGTLPAFEAEFADPIKRGGYANASQMQVQLAYRTALILKDLINPYLLRRLKKDIKEVQRMPGKKEQVLFCRLSDLQRTMYESFLRSDLVKKVMRGSAQMLGAITVMRKICNHPDLVCHPDDTDSFLRSGIASMGPAHDPYNSDEEDFYDENDDDDFIDEGGSALVSRSGKLEVLAKILPIWKKNGHRVLIFCQWKKMLDIIQRFTELQGWKFGRLDGNTDVAARQRLVDTFNSDENYFVMLCTTRVGGVGLNLTGADRIILYDPDWNPQIDRQARERAWRFGQEREVTVYRLISAGTVEEKIYHRQIFKTALSNRVLQDPRQRRLFSQKDLKDLFTLKADSGSIAEGSEGVTDTTRLTRGAGYVDPDENNVDADNDDDNGGDGETMQNVLRSSGLAGIFDHAVVEEPSTNKTASVLEMEARAKRIAQEALQALEQSVRTGPSSSSMGTGTGVGNRFIGVSSTTPAGDSGSGSLLAAISKRNQEIQKATAPSGTGEGAKYTRLLNDVKDFVKTNVPTTDEILQEFKPRMTGEASDDAAVFRRLLKSVASFQGGRWRLK